MYSNFRTRESLSVLVGFGIPVHDQKMHSLSGNLHCVSIIQDVFLANFSLSAFNDIKISQIFHKTVILFY